MKIITDTAGLVLRLRALATDRCDESEWYHAIMQQSADELEKLRAERDALAQRIVGQEEQLKALTKTDCGFGGYIDCLLGDKLKAEAERDALAAALTPSDDTKAAYIGEFSFSITYSDGFGNDVSTRHQVPWTTIKEIMAAISAKAALCAARDKARKEDKP